VEERRRKRSEDGTARHQTESLAARNGKKTAAAMIGLNPKFFLIESRTKLWYHLLANNVKTRSNTRHDFYVENPCGKKPRAQIGDLHYDERVTTQRIQ
jgi:hypothetical protein